MAVYGNVNVDYKPCKAVGQLKSAADYILGKKESQQQSGIIKTRNDLYNALGCNRDNFANSILINRKMHGKSYVHRKPNDILAHKLSLSFSKLDSKSLSYETAYRIGEEFAERIFIIIKSSKVLSCLQINAYSVRNITQKRILVFLCSTSLKKAKPMLLYRRIAL